MRGWIQRCEVVHFQRMREHGRTEHRRIFRVRWPGAAFQPGEERCVGWRQAVPHFLNIVRRDDLAAFEDDL